MKLGFVIPQLGPEVSAETTSAFAAAAEARGYDSLWVLDRLLFPTSLSQRYPASLDGTLPDLYRRVLDPLALLSFVAARTTSIKLGTSILNLPWYNPVLLGRMLASLDVLSNGRLQIGIGTGWSKEEYEAAGVNWSERGARTNEALQLMRTLWAEREPGFKGRYFSLPDSVIDLKPLQKPGPPVFMAAYSPAAMQRIANQGDGWMPAGIPIPAMKEMFKGIKSMAAQAGRDSESLRMIVRANIAVLPRSPGTERPPFVGTLDEIRADIHATREAGAHELLFDPQFSPDVRNLSDLRETLDTFYEMAAHA